jgi:hypothetical protein
LKTHSPTSGCGVAAGPDLDGSYILQIAAAIVFEKDYGKFKQLPCEICMIYSTFWTKQSHPILRYGATRDLPCNQYSTGCVNAGTGADKAPLPCWIWNERGHEIIEIGVEKVGVWKGWGFNTIF